MEFRNCFMLCSVIVNFSLVIYLLTKKEKECFDETTIRIEVKKLTTYFDDKVVLNMPSHWGSLTGIQTKDYVKLPLSFGYGSSTLKNWIENNIVKEIVILKFSLDTEEEKKERAEENWDFLYGHNNSLTEEYVKLYRFVFPDVSVQKERLGFERDLPPHNVFFIYDENGQVHNPPKFVENADDSRVYNTP